MIQITALVPCSHETEKGSAHAQPGQTVDCNDSRAKILIAHGYAIAATDLPPMPLLPAVRSEALSEEADWKEPPSWEFADGPKPLAPDHGGLPHPEAVKAWVDKSLLDRQRKAELGQKAANDALATVDLFYRTYPRRFQKAWPQWLKQRRDQHTDVERAWSAELRSATAEVDRALKRRWAAKELIAYGTRGGFRVIVPSSLRDQLDFKSTPPHGRTRTEGDFLHVYFYLVAEHHHLIAALTTNSTKTKGPKRDRVTDGAKQGGRAPAPYWGEAEREGRRWLDDNGYPVSGDGNQARMEQHVATWLAERGHEASEASVRRHVTIWIAEYRAEIGAGS